MDSEIVSPLLLELGFKRRSAQIFTIDVGRGVLGWLGLNRATKSRAKGEVEVNPVVGVRFQEVERLVAECRGEMFHKYIPPTICTPIGYLMHERKYRAWILGGPESDCSASNMVAAIRQFGLPFMQSVHELHELRERLDTSHGFEDQLIYRRPIAALLGGDVQGANEDLDRSLIRIGARTDIAAAQYRRFVDALRSRIPHEA